MRDASEQTTFLRELRSNGFYGISPKHPQLHGVFVKIHFLRKKNSQKNPEFFDFFSPFCERPIVVKQFKFHDLKEDILLRQLVPILRRFDMVQVVKLHEIAKNPKNFRKNRVFEASKIAQAENFRTFLQNQKGHSIADLFLKF